MVGGVACGGGWGGGDACTISMQRFLLLSIRVALSVWLIAHPEVDINCSKPIDT